MVSAVSISLHKLPSRSNERDAHRDERPLAALRSAGDDGLDEIGRAEITGQNAFEELRALHKREGGKEELVAFFNKLEMKIQ